MGALDQYCSCGHAMKSHWGTPQDIGTIGTKLPQPPNRGCHLDTEEQGHKRGHVKGRKGLVMSLSGTKEGAVTSSEA